MSTEINLDDTENNINKLLESGFETIIQAFKLKGNSYEIQLNDKNKKIINLKNKIQILQQEIEMIKNENIYFKSQIEQHKKKNSIISTINTTRNYDKKKRNETLYLQNDSVKNTNNDILNYKNNNNSSNNNNKKYNNSVKIRTNKLFQKCDSIENCEENNITERNLNIDYLDIVYPKSCHNKDKNDLMKSNKNITSYSTKNFLNNSKKEESKNIIKKNHSLNEIPYKENNFYTFKNKNNNNDDEIIENLNKNILNNGYNLLEESSSNINSKQTEQITNFLNECKIKLSKRNFEFIVQTFQNFKDGKINEEKVMLEIKTILQNYPQINNLFESIFIIK